MWYFLRPIDGSSACAKRRYTPINVAASQCFEWTEWEPATPTAKFIIVVSNVAASQCFEWTEWEPAAPTAEFIIVVSNVPASQCFEWTECII